MFLAISVYSRPLLTYFPILLDGTSARGERFLLVVVVVVLAVVVTADKLFESFSLMLMPLPTVSEFFQPSTSDFGSSRRYYLYTVAESIIVIITLIFL